MGNPIHYTVKTIEAKKPKEALKHVVYPLLNCSNILNVESVHMESDGWKKGLFPGVKTWSGISEDLRISLFPYFPGCHRENFHEELVRPLVLCLLDCAKEVHCVIPVNSQEGPALHTEWALEEQMISELFYAWSTKDTAIVVSIKLVVFPSQEIFGV